MEIPKSFLGYKRENGRAGTRNHVIILPVDDISNACAEAVANNIKGTIALPHSYGRLQFGADLELHFRTMIGTGSNPNVAAVIVIGIEPKWTKKIVDGIAKTGKPVEGFHIERTGDIGTVMKASKKAPAPCRASIKPDRTSAKSALRCASSAVNSSNRGADPSLRASISADISSRPTTPSMVITSS